MFIIKLFLRIDEPQGAISKEALPGTQMMISTHIETAYNTVIRSIIFRNEFFSFPVNNASINSLADLPLHGETFSRESKVIWLVRKTRVISTNWILTSTNCDLITLVFPRLELPFMFNLQELVCLVTHKMCCLEVEKESRHS